LATGYYLDCKTHKQAIYIFDNKANPFDKLQVEDFATSHGYGTGCDVRLESEHTLEFDHIYRFMLAMIGRYSELLSKDLPFTKEDLTKIDMRKISDRYEELREMYWR
jgi:hypothetical protein